MAIIRWNPFNIDRLFDEDWDLPTLPGISRLAGQGLNIYETDTEVVAEAALPGIPEDKIDVTIDDSIVRITGASEEKKEDKDRKRYFMSSMEQSFNYSFRLPRGIIPDQEPVCEFDNGVLRIVFPKSEKQAPKKIRVQRKIKEESK